MRWFSRNIGLLAAYSERRYAKQASEQLLNLYRREQREHPELKERALYEAVIARRLGLNPSVSPAVIVQRAGRSFTAWPVERELTFRHVVHYQIFNEYMSYGEVGVGTRTNIGAAVARIIPEEL